MEPPGKRITLSALAALALSTLGSSAAPTLPPLVKLATIAAPGFPDIAWSPDGRRVAVVGKNRLTAYDPRGRQVLAFVGPVAGDLPGSRAADATQGIAWSSDGTLLATVGFDLKARLWSTATGRVVRVIGPFGAGGETYVAWSPDSKTLSLPSDGRLGLYDPASGRRRTAPNVGAVTVRQVAFSPDGKRLAVRSEAGANAVYDVGTGRRLSVLAVAGEPGGLAWTRDGRLLVGESAGGVGLYDAASGRQLVGPKPGDPLISTVAVAPGGGVFAAGEDASRVSLREPARPATPLFAPGLEGLDAVNLAFSPDGRYLAVTTDDEVMLWGSRDRSVIFR